MKLTHYLNAIQQANPQIVNWREDNLNDLLLYSFRSTRYDRQTYPARMHYHDYYELVVFIEGDIRYICESVTWQPHCGDIILIPPRKLHMSFINADTTLYKRHVFYLFPDALDELGCSALTRFLEQSKEGQYLLTPSQHGLQELLSLLARLDQTLQKEADERNQALQKEADERNQALARGLVIEIFYWLSEASIIRQSSKTWLPDKMINIQRYIDEHFAEIDSVSQVAANFFYSREYVSRLFHQHFNITVANYIMQRRIAQSQTLIAQGTELIDVYSQVGFGSLTTFIRSFRTVTKMTPSQYRSLVRGA